MDINKLKFDAQGLITAVIQDYYTKEVLTVAYMNHESLDISLREGRTCFWSRSRQELWRKGETSGNVQKIINIKADCDYDALCIEVIKEGPACHTGAESCFGNEIYQCNEKQQFSLSALYGLISERKKTPVEGSYTSYLFDKGLDKILKKVGEECTEVIIGAKNDEALGKNEEAIYELADLTYHSLVLMVQRGIPLSSLLDELAKRHIVDKKVKQETLK
ncbi:MAG: bifunctional phosphoribosyl-AMP cyclohydrolase/phosphoribosyl-ATP diphosphatase HisIE [Hydrogenoanaerobacterium sp.]